MLCLRWLEKTTRLICEEPSRLPNEKRERESSSSPRTEALTPSDWLSVDKCFLINLCHQCWRGDPKIELCFIEPRWSLAQPEQLRGSIGQSIARPVPGWKPFRWLLFVSVSSSPPVVWSLASTLVFRQPCWEPGLGGRGWISQIYRQIGKNWEKNTLIYIFRYKSGALKLQTLTDRTFFIDPGCCLQRWQRINILYILKVWILVENPPKTKLYKHWLNSFTY